MMNSSPGPPWAARRASSAVSGCSGPSEIVPSSTGVPSRLWASIVAGSLAGRRRRRLDLLALDDHRAEVAADAAPLPPGLAPQLDGQRVELAEVGGSLDGCAGRPSDAAVSPSCTLLRPSFDCSWSIWAGPRHGPVSVIWVSKAAIAPTLAPPGTARDGPPAVASAAAALALVAEAAQGPGPLRPAVHAGLADAEPLGRQRPGQPVAAATRSADSRSVRCSASRWACDPPKCWSTRRIGSSSATTSSWRSSANATTARHAGRPISAVIARVRAGRRGEPAVEPADHAVGVGEAPAPAKAITAWRSLNTYHGVGGRLRRPRVGERSEAATGVDVVEAQRHSRALASSISIGTPSDPAWWTSAS